LTDEQIQDAVTAAVKSRHLSWLGFKKDANDEYTIPVLSPSDFQFARVIAAVVQSPVPAPQTAGYAAGLERAAALCDERAAQHAVMSPAAAECESMAAAIRAVQAPAEGDELAPLPEPAYTDQLAFLQAYSADQMHAYFRAALASKVKPKGTATPVMRLTVREHSVGSDTLKAAWELPHGDYDLYPAPVPCAAVRDEEPADSAVRQDAERWRALQLMWKADVIAGMDENGRALRTRHAGPWGLTERVDAKRATLAAQPPVQGSQP
jgi:hypothetical protein